MYEQIKDFLTLSIVLPVMGHIIPRPLWIRQRVNSLSLYRASIKVPYFFQNGYRASYRTLPVSLGYRPNIPVKDDIFSCTKTYTSYGSL